MCCACAHLAPQVALQWIEACNVRAALGGADECDIDGDAAAAASGEASEIEDDSPVAVLLTVAEAKALTTSKNNADRALRLSQRNAAHQEARDENEQRAKTRRQEPIEIE